MTTMVYVRFSYAQDGTVSEEYGPFDFLQVTYNTLRTSPDGDELAALARDGYWFVGRDSEGPYSDFTIYSRNTVVPPS